LNNPGGIDLVRRRSGLVSEMDQAFLNDYQADAVRARIAGYDTALQLMDLEKARTAFRIDLETPQVRSSYGDTIFGRQCLGARRLIENGVKFVEVMHPNYWDTHG